VKLVVTELVVDHGPNRVCRGLGAAHDVAHILGDGDVEPGKDALIHDLPIVITVLRGGGRLDDVVGETELAEESIHEAPPLIIVGVGKGEDDGNKGTDVHHLQDGSRRGGNGDVARPGEGLAVRGVGVESIGLEQGVTIHVIHEIGEGSGDGRSSGGQGDCGERGASERSRHEAGIAVSGFRIGVPVPPIPCREDNWEPTLFCIELKNICLLPQVA
jgi:hypothetical protein